MAIREKGVPTVVRYRRLSEEDITLSRHSSSDGMYSKSNIDSFGPQHLSDFGDRILCFCNRHTVTNNLEWSGQKKRGHLRNGDGEQNLQL
jgi:hypothetical protein